MVLRIYLEQGLQKGIRPDERSTELRAALGPEPLPEPVRLGLSNALHGKSNRNTQKVDNYDTFDDATPDRTRLRVAHKAPCLTQGMFEESG